MRRWTRPGLVALFAASVVAGALPGWSAAAYRDDDFSPAWVASRTPIEDRDPHNMATCDAALEQIGGSGLPNLPDLALRYPLPTAVHFMRLGAPPREIAALSWLVAQASHT